MPNRILRDGILRSPAVTRLGWAEEVFYRRLHSVVDDYGCYYADPGMLRADCYPRQLHKVSDSDIGKWLTVLVEAALVRVYPASDGERYLQVLKFRQQIRAKESKFPQPPSDVEASAQPPPSIRVADATQAHTLDVDVSGDVSVDDLSKAYALEVAGQEPDDPTHVNGKTPKFPDCPHQQIIDLYHRVLPLNPQVRQWHATRQGYLRQRWREQATAKHWLQESDGMAWFERYFGFVADSKFLTGRAPPSQGRQPFVADLEWLLKPDNFAKVIEGKYP